MCDSEQRTIVTLVVGTKQKLGDERGNKVRSHGPLADVVLSCPSKEPCTMLTSGTEQTTRPGVVHARESSSGCVREERGTENREGEGRGGEGRGDDCKPLGTLTQWGYSVMIIHVRIPVHFFVVHATTCRPLHNQCTCQWFHNPHCCQTQ